MILPDHVHTLWTLPEDDVDYAGRWRAIKSRFTRSIRAMGVPFDRNRRGEHRLWLRRFREHTIRDEHDYAHHMNYCHWNPIRHGLVQNLADWPHSSFHRYVRSGLLSPDWSGHSSESEAEDGETPLQSDELL